MREVRARLEVAGYDVNSRWIDPAPEFVDRDFTVEAMNDSPTSVIAASVHARRDLLDIATCDAFVVFTGRVTKGGRHVELGYALGLLECSGIRPAVILVGKRENIFHCLPTVACVDNVDEMLNKLDELFS